ncbi:RecBCD inhibitor [Pseudomonas phage PlaquesPlease]|uniref:RecBCD inhibitor n=1 Tax=Pseudomonas phage PlaquesPlease TaxID=2762289 RepID=A0A7G8LJR9_9CAUD|nr:RecBCD inhibitor [Pseudomonas phage PlaquesPlease]
MSVETLRLIPSSRLLELLQKEERLYALESGGVDSWEGYDDALEIHEDQWEADQLLETYPESTYQ